MEFVSLTTAFCKEILIVFYFINEDDAGKHQCDCVCDDNRNVETQ